MKKLIAKIVPLAYGQYFNLSSIFAPKYAAHKAFNVFCTIRKGKVLPQQKPYLDQAKLAVENVAGHAIQTYQWPGTMETVLLVHGWESNTFRWRNLIQKLQEAQYNIIAFDAPSHGYSTGKLLYAPLYEEVLHYMVKKHDPRYLVGHSMGGLTLMYNEYKNPNPGVKKMVVIGAPSEFHEIMQQYQDILKFNDRFMGLLDNYIFNRFGFQIKDFSTSKFAKTNTKQGLLFHDKLDMVAPYHASKQVHASWKGSKLVTTEGLGHSMHQEEVNDEIISFLVA
ncbi:alpha/beta hydrolase [Flagellimonas algicola]|uniref:Alpha/beta hydrolase n=1 Tax=Flagellimonas algicola TaxID=2583815 RepID=A0ABY2WRE0_9FLAO|nr:alpha/beta hydrolase [Allomuricauda algicola]TMU57518.1 alpha/beta hydrolase [Allomuricauda algicola]